MRATVDRALHSSRLRRFGTSRERADSRSLAANPVEEFDAVRAALEQEYFSRKRICDPALLDSTLLYLVSPASEAITGIVIEVDDGQGTY